jgi:hypothetical protein
MERKTARMKGKNATRKKGEILYIDVGRDSRVYKDVLYDVEKQVI